MQMVRLMRVTAALLLALSASALAGCGGGGGGSGGGGGTTNITGTILRAETNTAPNPTATITGGGGSAVSGADGVFTLNGISASTTSLSVAAQSAQTLTLPVTLTANTTNNLGTIFISDTGYTANVTGRVITQDTGVAVGNATVILAGQKTITATDGTFHFSGMPIGLGNVNGTYGTITANGFQDKPITADILSFPLEAGANPLGDIRIASPVGSTAPLPPYTIGGNVRVSGQIPSTPIAIQLLVGSTPIGSTQTDASGNYAFWVAGGTYTISIPSQQSMQAQQATVTLSRLDQPVYHNFALTP